mmetsp:Transcript_3213/g.5047  ORF Transcript_3213/g.5047 Transcript_3213/m.5047 type:complete len:1807 (-) Transcript_3213:521-5941(-)
MSGNDDGNNNKIGGFGNAFKGFGSSVEKLRQQAADVANKATEAASKAVVDAQKQASLGADGNVTGKQTPQTQQPKTTDGSATPTPMKAFNPQTSTKEEVLAVLGRLNKKYKQINTERMALQKRADKAERDHSRLLHFVKNEVLSEQDVDEAKSKINGSNESPADEVEVISLAWRNADESRSLMMGQIQNEFKANSLKLQAETEERMRDEVLEKIEAVKSELNKQHLAILESTVEKLKSDHLIEIEEMREKISGPDKGDNAIGEALKIAEKKHSDEVERLRANAGQEFEQMKLDIQKSHEQDVSRLQKLHLEELNRTKEQVASAFHAQMESLKGQHSDAIRDTEERKSQELQKIRIEEAELRDLAKKSYEAEISQVKEEAKAEHLRLKVNHVAEIDRMKKELNVSHQQQLKDLKQSQELVVSAASESHLEEVEKLRQEAAEQLEQALVEAKQKLAADTAKVNEEVICSLKDEIKQMKADHRAEVDRLRVELADSFETEMDNLKKRHHDELCEAEQVRSKEIEQVVSQSSMKFQHEQEAMNISHVEEMDRLRRDAASNLHAQIEKLKEEHKIEIESVQQKLHERLNDQELMAKDESKRAIALEEQLHILSTEKESITSNAAVEIAQVKAEAASSYELKIANEKSEMVASHKEELAKALDDLKAVLEDRHATELSTALDRVRSECATAVKEVEREMKIATQNSYTKMSKLEEQLRVAAEEMEHVKAKAAREVDDAKALASAGEGTQQELEEALMKQRDSYEATIVELQDRHNSSLTTLQTALESSKRELELSIDNFAEEKDELKSRFGKEVKDLKESSVNHEKTVQQLREEIKTRENEISALSEDVKSLIEAKAKMESNTSESKRREAILQQLLEKIRLDNNAKDTQIVMLTGQLDESRELEAKVTETAKAQTKDLESRETQIKELSSQLSFASEQKSSLEGEVNDLKATVEKLRNEIEAAKAAHELAKIELSAQINSDKDAISNLQARYDEANSSNVTLAEELQNLKKCDSSELIHLREELKATKRFADDLKGKLEAASEAHKSATNQVESSKAEVADIQAKLDEVNASNLALTEEMHTLKDGSTSELENIRNALEEMKSRVNEVEAEKSEAISTLEDKYLEEISERDLLAATLQAEHANELQLLQHENSKMKAELSSLSDQMARSNSELEVLAALRQEIEERKSQIDELQSFTSNFSEIEKSKVELGNKLKEMEKEHAHEINDLKSRVKQGIASYKAEIKQLQESLDEQKSSNIALNERLKSVDDLHASEMRSVQEKEHSTASELCRLKEENERLMQSTSKLEEELTTMHRDEIQEARKSLEASEELVAEQKKSIQNLEDKISALEESQVSAVESIRSEFSTRYQAALAKHKTILANADEVRSSNTKKIQELEANLSKSRQESSAQQKEITTMKGCVESAKDAERSLKDQVKDLETKLNETIANSRSTSTSLLERQEELESENAKLKNAFDQSKKRAMIAQNKNEELSGKLTALSTSLDSMIAEKDETIALEKDKLINMESDYKHQLKVAAGELTTAREETSAVKAEQATLESVIARMKSEREATERRHGQRTALVGMLEAQLAEIKEEAYETKRNLDEAMSNLDEKTQDFLMLEKQLEEAKATAVKAQKLVEEAGSRSNASVEIARKEVEREHRARMDSLQQQMARKSASAQKLLQQREQECIELRKANKAMKHELDSGSSSDRRIFELAAKQSNRESLVASEIEIREQLMNKLVEALSARDGELASVENAVIEVEEQVEDLCRIKRREDVNLDYLKSVIVKFLSLPTGSSEKASLLPVLATLLQV